MARTRSILRDSRYMQFVERYYDNLLLYVLENASVCPTWQQAEFLDACSKPGARVAVSSGHGCFGKGTPILLHDGRVKPVEEIRTGDLLMGDDGTPRTVGELHRGRENLYRFEFMDGVSHVYNESHILCLVATQSHGLQRTGDKKEVTVHEYLSWSERKQRTHASYRTGCNFPKCDQDLLIPPYILGLWLGDGTRRVAQITNPDHEVQNEILKYARECGYGVFVKKQIQFNFSNNKKQKNGFNEKLRKLGIWEHKQIPHCYLTASKEDRLELLAGLIDTDGTLDSRGRRVLSITQKQEDLADEIVFLARSLGIHASKKMVRKTCTNTGAVGTYFTISLTRNIEMIPVRMDSKRPLASCNMQRSNLHFGIRSVTPLGEGDYYGFELDGNRRFLSGDFTVLHNTGKSWCLAWLLDWNLRCFPMSNALLTATNIEQARSVVWKYLDEVIETIEKVYPWQRDMFIKETRRYYAACFKDAWYVLPKTASKANPENLAGQHNENLLIVVDEASGVPDPIHEVLRGALTGPRNRYVMTSQPTRPSGYFWEAMNKLNKPQANGIYDAIYMNSEESPIVSREFIKNALIEYGGHSSPEYQIRVLGIFPDNLSGFLIPRHWVMECMDAKVDMDTGDWGYALLCDVAEGVHRDSSVAHLVKMGGFGKERKVVSLQCEEFLDLNEKEFARYIASIYNQYPNLTVAVDADGAGRAVVLDLEEVGIPVTHIHWGLPCHAEADKRRYANLRAYAHYKLREAIFDGRFRGPKLKKFVEQASRLPYSINERGQYVMETKERMKANGIKSPDISDTCCFCFLIDYIPADAGSMPQKDNWRREIAASLGDEDAFLDFGSKTKQ